MAYIDTSRSAPTRSGFRRNLEYASRHRNRDEALSLAVEVITHYFSTLPKQMAGTERIVTMRRRLAELYVQHYPLRIIPAPIPLSLIQEHMVRLVREEIIKTVGVEARREAPPAPFTTPPHPPRADLQA